MTLKVNKVSKKLGGRRVLDRLSLELDGGALAVIGQNGCGKTTLLRIVAGVLPADQGAVLFDDEPAARSRHRLGFVPEAADPPAHLTVDELLALVAALRRAPALDGDLKSRLGLDDTARQRIGSLSLGQRRRACLGAALIGAPWLLVLDEPTNGLDPGGVALLAELLRDHAGRGAILFATHDLDFADAIGARRLDLTRSGRSG
jgi:ABC-2 type transport system ATP-binding protein